ncbi:MAG: argininosuccinate lyase [Elusimicrobia bacterium]|nr:argininosuccinate lyase [Elusimicrobiota bacterium]
MTTTAPKLWQTKGGLDAEVEAYTVGDDYLLDARLLPHEVYGSIAHAAGLVKAKLLTADEFIQVRDALKRLLLNPGDFKVTPGQEDIHTAVEQHLTEKLGPVGAKVHTGRSRNDQVQTDLRLYMKERLLHLHGMVCEASEAWAAFGRKHEKTLIPGYTHLQRAMPTTVGHWAASHSEALLENARTLASAYDDVDCSPLGSAAGYGAPLPLDRDYTAALMGFSRVQRNTLRVQTSRPRIEACVLSALALLARDLGVMAEDVVLYATAEFGFLKLDSSFTTGSSIMPQKRNPDVVELTRAKAALFPGWLQQVLAVGAVSSGYHRDYQVTKGTLFLALDTARQMVDMMLALPSRLTVNAERCALAVTEDMLATQKALDLARRGVPFREAYRQVADAARKHSGAAGAKGAKLPDYPGAPGNPGFEELAKERSEATAWSGAERDLLYGAWGKLLKIRP